MADHVHILISIPPKYAVAQVVGFIKGKSAIHIASTYLGRRRNFLGQNFWARGYFVSTVGKDETTVRQYIKKQEKEDRRLDQLTPREFNPQVIIEAKITEDDGTARDKVTRISTSRRIEPFRSFRGRPEIRGHRLYRRSWLRDPPRRHEEDDSCNQGQGVYRENSGSPRRVHTSL
jgi:hypothetical protein